MFKGNNIDLKSWVDESINQYKLQRSAIHTILLALSITEDLKSHVFLKGGILLGVKYGSSRYTTDIDLSDTRKIQDNVTFDETAFNASLMRASGELTYGLSLKVQKVKLNPKTIGEYNSYVISVGYARTNSPEHKRLKRKQCPHIIKMDYSLNESVPDNDNIAIEFGSDIKTYGIYTLVAEKIRALIQQTIKNKNRRQDIYDLNYLILNGYTDSVDKVKLKKIVIQKCNERKIKPDKETFSNPELKSKSEHGYDELIIEGDVDGSLDNFEDAFSNVKAFYESLFFNNL